MKKFELKENTHLILKQEDIANHLDNYERDILDQFLIKIFDGRKEAGKEPINKYYLCNQDEHYAQEVFDLIKKSIMIRDVVENDFMALGEDGDTFAIEREVFDNLFKELDPMDPYIGFDEEELMKMLLIDWYAAIPGETVVEVDVKEWYESIEKPQFESMDDETYFEKDTKKEGKHYTFRFWYDCK